MIVRRARADRRVLDASGSAAAHTCQNFRKRQRTPRFNWPPNKAVRCRVFVVGWITYPLAMPLLAGSLMREISSGTSLAFLRPRNLPNSSAAAAAASRTAELKVHLGGRKEIRPGAQKAHLARRRPRRIDRSPDRAGCPISHDECCKGLIDRVSSTRIPSATGSATAEVKVPRHTLLPTLLARLISARLLSKKTLLEKILPKTRTNGGGSPTSIVVSSDHAE